MAMDNVYWFAEDGTVQHMAIDGLYLNEHAKNDLESEVIRLPVYSRTTDGSSWYILVNPEDFGFEVTTSTTIPESIHLYRLLTGDG